MVKLKLATYEEVLSICEEHSLEPKLRTLAYRLFEGETRVGFCLFSMEGNTCTIELSEVETPAFDLLDGLLKASIAYCFSKGAVYFSFARESEQTLFSPILQANKLEKEPYPIEPVIGHCDHDCENCKGCGS